MITVLCVRKNSIYKKLGCDCYDRERDMNMWPGGNSIIAHPPCAQWSQLRGLAKNNPDEKILALKCAALVRRYGGVLEHPSGSILFGHRSENAVLPLPGKIDKWGGYSICINQHWFGHPAIKKTLLYIVGVSERDLPNIPYSMNAVTRQMEKWKNKNGNRVNGKKQLSKPWRERTPLDLARWLIETAELCNKNFISLQSSKHNQLCRDATGQE